MKNSIRLALAVCIAVSAFGASHPPKLGRSAAQPRQFPAPALRESIEGAAVVQRLPKLDAFEIDALKRANANDGRLEIGVVRTFENAVAVAPAAALSGPVQWRGKVAVEGGYRLRAKLTEIDLAPDTILWVYGASGEAIGFDPGSAFEGTLWTPTVEGSEITIEVRSSRHVAFRIAAVADIRPEWEVTTTGTECFRDLACHSEYGVQDSATAIASYTFISGSSVGACSGGLIIDAAETFQPYFLTARHCVSTATEAATVEAVWDYRAASCNALPPSRASRPKTVGATLLATSAMSDVTLLKLSSVPGTRYWLGWSADVLPAGTPVHRVSHPQAGPQKFTRGTVDTSFVGCSSSPRPGYVYQSLTTGGTTGGSSGAPLLWDEGFIVGQLRS
ncbi:MAG TPA: trypsin-like peptidase domain-containing protein, partial [Thermoanaerobaculia bacterium]